uniref:PDZ domain-containing protein n=1 Tax=Elaeophora elaphi TaxID=1147741 RepID=A0A0R3S0J1_9BILA
MDGSGSNYPGLWDHSGPSEETIILNKPFGLRIQKTTWKIVYVDEHGAAANLAFVGDIILSIDDVEIHDLRTLVEIMQKSTTKAFVKLRRNAYSHCRRIQSTIETLIMRHETKLLRAVNVYRVCVHATDMLTSDESDLLGLSVSYDARERLQVASTRSWSLAAIHLHPGDTIKEVDHHPVASKSMLQYWILESMEKNGFVELLIHSNVDQNIIYDYELEMPEDVIAIAAKQIAVLQKVSSKQYEKRRKILRKRRSLSKRNRSISISDKVIELSIASDYDPKTLRKSRKGRAQQDKLD